MLLWSGSYFAEVMLRGQQVALTGMTLQILAAVKLLRT